MVVAVGAAVAAAARGYPRLVMPEKAAVTVKGAVGEAGGRVVVVVVGAGVVGAMVVAVATVRAVEGRILLANRILPLEDISRYQRKRATMGRSNLTGRRSGSDRRI